MQGSTIRLIICLLAFLVLATLFLWFVSFHVATTAVPVTTKDGSRIFHHKCIYLSLRGTHEYESNFPWPTADDAEHADCTYFDY